MTENIDSIGEYYISTLEKNKTNHKKFEYRVRQARLTPQNEKVMTLYTIDMQHPGKYFH